MTEKICYTIERHVSGISLAGTIKYAPVAQLDRALDSDSKGRWFESSRAYQMNTTRVSNFFIEIRVVSYEENLDLLGFSVFLYFHAVFVK